MVVLFSFVLNVLAGKHFGFADDGQIITTKLLAIVNSVYIYIKHYLW